MDASFSPSSSPHARLKSQSFPGLLFCFPQKDLDAIMSELETTDNFRSFVNGDGTNDDGDYENDDNYQDDVGVQDEEEVDSEL
ncbi:hypothetical protein JHK84_031812 [Glycine max]|nr:hypothetical protein JHK86_031672 [Glycine max]KAG5146269.1 hypothetical protein JHK84_031812 [Glycine max]